MVSLNDIGGVFIFQLGGLILRENYNFTVSQCVRANCFFHFHLDGSDNKEYVVQK